MGSRLALVLPQQAHEVHRRTAAMATTEFLLHPFSAVEKTTFQAEQGAQKHDLPEHALESQQNLTMRSQMRWLVCRIPTRKSTTEVFDLLWQPLLAKGSRRLSVRRGPNQEALHGFIHKAGRHELPTQDPRHCDF